MARATTLSFVCELPLRVTPAQERTLLVRLDGGRQVYNACLGEALKRLNRLRDSADFQTARSLRRQSPERKAAFKALEAEFGLSEYALHGYAVQFSHSWLGEHLDANTIQKLATRAYKAVRAFQIGQRGRPRFKGRGQFDSVEGKSNKAGILWREGAVRWLGLEIPALIDRQDAVIAHGLSCRVKYVRLVRRKIAHHDRFYAQLVCEGEPYRKPKHALGTGTVGLDLGPSTLAVVSKQTATLEHFCADLQPSQSVTRRLQRKLDRSRRATNPEYYRPDGTVKPGPKRWTRSASYQRTRAQLAEVRRKQAAYRKSLHGRLVHRVLALGDTIQLEKLSYRSFQRAFGNSVSFRGPGLFVAHLRRKAANAGGGVVEFATGSTRLSQTCVCGSIVKKPLAQRWHVCECEAGPIQRDLMSAWLARYVVNERLDADQAMAAWTGEDERLRAASSVIQPAMRQGNPPLPAIGSPLPQGQSRSPAHSALAIGEAGQVGTFALIGEPVDQPEPPGFSRGE